MIPDDVRRELDAIKRRVEQLEKLVTEHGPLERRFFEQVNAQVNGITRGLEGHVKAAIHSELRPHLDKLQELTGLAESLKGHQGAMDKAVKLLERQEIREELAEKERKDAKDNEEIALKKKEREASNRAMWLGFAGVILVAFIGLIGTMIASHYK